ncbi:arylamine N-acetyltransferase family protein [Sciscionella marina]|uniref:arylamine N-acetyltransferase family protein n=1 Tax=Sciscionella marina TaxID=508770 RepID=UPI00036DAC06|nr:arylamine N-acetyltransferase [Sciscionella marina]
MATMQTITPEQFETATVDVDAYLAHVGVPRRPPSAAALHELTEAHARTFPFENLDVMLGRRPDLDLGAIVDKLLHRGRGGYCYEHVLLFAAVLERLGYRAWRVLCRRNPQGSGYRTHASVIVDVEGSEYLADVGFGLGMPQPMRLTEGARVDQSGKPHRMMLHDGAWTLEQHGPQGWIPLHSFDLEPAWPSDFELANHFISSHPRSPFVGKIVVFRTEADRVCRLVGNTFTIEYPGGRSEERTVTAAEVPELLGSLGIALDEEESAGIRRALAV